MINKKHSCVFHPNFTSILSSCSPVLVLLFFFFFCEECYYSIWNQKNFIKVFLWCFFFLFRSLCEYESLHNPALLFQPRPAPTIPTKASSVIQIRLRSVVINIRGDAPNKYREVLQSKVLTIIFSKLMTISLIEGTFVIVLLIK